MAQHFLLSSAAKTLGLVRVMGMSDQEAEVTFRKVRWPETNGEPVCPHCGGLGAYENPRPKGAMRYAARLASRTLPSPRAPRYYGANATRRARLFTQTPCQNPLTVFAWGVECAPIVLGCWISVLPVSCGCRGCFLPSRVRTSAEAPAATSLLRPVPCAYPWLDWRTCLRFHCNTERGGLPC